MAPVNTASVVPELVLANINSVLDKNLLELLHYGRHSPKFPVTKYEVQIIEYILPIFLGVELPDMSVYISFRKVVLEGYILRHFLMVLKPGWCQFFFFLFVVTNVHTPRILN